MRGLIGAICSGPQDEWALGGSGSKTGVRRTAVVLPMSLRSFHHQHRVLGWTAGEPYGPCCSLPLHSDQVGNQGVSLSWWRLILWISSSSWSRWEACCWHYWIQMLWLMDVLIRFFCIFPFPCPWDARVSLTNAQGFVFSRKCNYVVPLEVTFRRRLP